MDSRRIAAVSKTAELRWGRSLVRLGTGPKSCLLMPIKGPSLGSSRHHLLLSLVLCWGVLLISTLPPPLSLKGTHPFRPPSLHPQQAPQQTKRAAPRPAASGSPENLLEMQILGFSPDPKNQELLQWGPATHLPAALQWIWMHKGAWAPLS